VVLWSVERSVAVAAGTAAPVESLATPRILPKVDCPKADRAHKAERKKARPVSVVELLQAVLIASVVLLRKCRRSPL